VPTPLHCEHLEPRHTHVQDGGEGRGGDVGADGGEHGLADLPDVAAGLGEQRQQDVHHHLRPVGLRLLLSCGGGVYRESQIYVQYILQYILQYIQHIHIHAQCVCVCVCVFLLYLKHLTFYANGIGMYYRVL